MVVVCQWRGRDESNVTWIITYYILGKKKNCKLF